MIRFYDPRNPWGFFSNFSRHQVTIYGRTWQTSEHAFQAMKFHPHRPDLVTAVHAAPTPGKACVIGRDRSLPRRIDWEDPPGVTYGENMMERVPRVSQPNDGIHRAGVTAEPLFRRVKDIFMFEIVRAKFTQNADLKDAILATNYDILVEDAEHDPYWGWGASHVGENKLGRILMAVRSVLRP